MFTKHLCCMLAGAPLIGRATAGALSDWLTAELPARGRVQVLPGDKRSSSEAEMDISSSGGVGRKAQRSSSRDRPGGEGGGLSPSGAEGAKKSNVKA